MSMSSMPIPELISRYGIISDQITEPELTAILRELEYVLATGPDGAIVEFGCYSGTTSLYIQRLLDTHGQREFHVYDSFAGLPEKTAPDASPAGEQFKAGELLAPKKDFIMNFKKAGLQLPRIHKGWFDELVPTDVPEPIAFAFLDGDYYESVRIPLELITPKLARHAVIVVDDYANLALPGAARATDEWAQRHGYDVRSEQSLAIIHT